MMRTIATRLSTLVLVPMLFVLSGLAAKAELFVQDWQTPGDRLLTLDTATGLQWLNVTVTLGLSWNVATAELEVGGRFAGFRRATDPEVATFWADAGIPYIGAYQPTTANFETVMSLQQIWGNTGRYQGPAVTSTWVTTADSFDPVDNMVEGTGHLRLYENEGTATAQLRFLFGRPPSDNFPFVAHALVQPIPEPRPFILFIFGIAFCGLIRRTRDGHREVT